jgi:RHS repeat-associated protein
MYNAISGETVTYTYDSLNRLATAGGSGWGEAYTFDPFGNLTTKQVTSGTGPSLSVSVNQSNNQITSVYGQGYDANGNTTDGNMTAYDAENHLVGAGWNFGAPAVDYGYDAQGKRSFMWTAGTFDPVGNNATNYSVVMYSPSGQKLGTYQISVCNQGPNNTTALTICSALQTSDKYFGGRRLAVLDQLGSAGTYYPWGEAKGTTNPQDAWSYATYWRDSATGLDYANQRYYSNTYGRFMTPDPYQGSASTSYPQSWNRYVYVVGDPVNRIDPGGLCGWWSFSDCADGEGPDFMSPNRPEGAGGGPCIGTGLGFESADPTCLKVFVPVFLPGKKPAKPPAPYLAALVLIGDCYDRSANAVGQAGGAAVDDLTYQALDQYGNPYLGAATINEKNTIMSGDTTSINTSWTLAGGMFEDNISSGIQSSLQELESYFVSGSVTPLTINWFYGAQYAVLGVYATPKAIIINNTVPVNKDGTPHYCDQPSSIQNR